MHYHNIFLVKAVSKKHALKVVEAFLEPYSENLDVEPYKEYMDADSISRMINYYSEKKDITLDSDEKIIEYLVDWHGGHDPGKDENGFYVMVTYNSNGEWDWYQWGGRWSWWDYEKEYESVLFKPQTKEQEESGHRTYWNRYHGPEVKGRKALVVFPDGTEKLIEYGTPYPFQRWCNDNPTYFDVIDATHPDFFEHINRGIESWAKNIKHYKKSIEGDRWADNHEHKKWLRGQIMKAQNVSRWCTEKYFFNVESKSIFFDKDELMLNPKQWFLVNGDLHT